jgi:hypothetical protein
MWARNGRWILLEMPDFHVAFKVLLHAVNLRHGTDGFTSPPKEGVPKKIRRLRPGLNPPPRNLGTKVQPATSRPPKPLGSHLLTVGHSLLVPPSNIKQSKKMGPISCTKVSVSDCPHTQHIRPDKRKPQLWLVVQKPCDHLPKNSS